MEKTTKLKEDCVPNSELYNVLVEILNELIKLNSK